jgi:light-regulated signal transduction histidine kinase (bacteriophytochrome)
MERRRATAPVIDVEYNRAILNILEDFSAERERLGQTHTAVLNILDDFMEEKNRLVSTERAVVNILDDFSEEKSRLEQTQRAVLNILDDFSSEKALLEQTQKAVLNILDDFDDEKSKVEAANEQLLREASERRSAEEALKEKSLALTQSNADLEQFAYVASHDLQEPLRMVSSYVQLFAKRYEGNVDAQADKYIRYAVEGVIRMQALIDGLLEYSRVGRHAEQPGPVSAETALERALYNLRTVIEEAGATIDRAALPEVLSDDAQLAQVFQNLIGNALKFRRPDVAARIGVECARRGPYFVFSVADNGIGIDPRYAERIFAVFQRLHTRAEYPGTGIGLSICKKVVERSGGEIWLESAPGQGSTFHFTLKAAKEPT